MTRLSITEAAAKLRAGGLVAFPTETVYGLGANALDADAVRRVFEMKGRPSTSPLIVHVASIEAARELVTEWSPLAEQLARAFWPGPLTLVLPKRSTIPDIITAGLGTVGVRMPAHPVALELITAAGVPVAAPSANRFMGVSPTTAEHVRAAFGDQLEVLDGGPCQVGIESTVVAVTGDKLMLLRPGMISLAELERVAQQTIAVANDPSEPNAAHASPGQHHRHYSPRAPLMIVGPADSLPAGDGTYVWHTTQRSSAAKEMQMPADPAGYAARLYSVLHSLDREDLPWIAIEALPDGSEWNAIRDRLQRAASK
jgi:L-threonylcarbamoyladenylate synthase